MRELSIDVLLLEVLPRKVALHTSSHLTPIEAWRSAVSTTSKGRRASSEVLLENCTQVWGGGQIWTACNSRLRKIALHTCSDLFKLVRTCLSQSAIQWPCTPVAQCHFFCNFQCSYSSVLRPILLKLHILTRLMESFRMVYELWPSIEVK